MSPEARRPLRERRRRQRAELNRTGELFVALGTASLAAALVGRDNWRWGNIAVFSAVALLIVGAALNREFLRQMLLFRGASRRATPDENVKTADAQGKITPARNNGDSRISGVSPIVGTSPQKLRIR